MEDFINIDRTFEKLVSFDARISSREFDGCTFKNCEFSNSVFAQCMFIDCTFIECNLSMVKLPATGLKTVVFRDCKLLGIRFDECDDFLFNVNFQDCVLDYSWFVNKKMPKTGFVKTSLKGVNFSGADLSMAVFDNTNLDGAVFDGTQLKAADLRPLTTSRSTRNKTRCRKRKFSVGGIPGLLQKYDIKIE
jgi:uncharacterized protein YjbI with pentapeptide repeats